MSAVTQQPLSDPPGTRIADRYRVIAALGRGGMGRVYRALDETTGKRIALKRATFPKDREDKLAVLFEREYRTLATLDHPCIIRVLDFGRDERGPYYTMELLEGQDLRELSPLPYRDACRYLRDVASSLALLHARRLVHRDVSPANVRIAGDDHAKLIDFGALASFGTARDVIGTPPCVPPESVRGQPLDQRSDLYAFGAVMYYALTGRHAYHAREINSLHAAWAIPPQPPSARVPGIPEQLDDLVLSLLSFDPNARPQSAAAVIDQLNVIAELDADGGEHHHAEAYLRSAALIGRERELRRLDKRIELLAEEEKHVVLLTGTTGIGKTRLLAELALRARMANVKVLSAAAESHREPYGVVRKLALDLIDLAPELASRTAEPHLPVLGHVVPELRDRAPGVQLEQLPRDPSERRARIQRALGEWLCAVTQGERFVLSLDNVEHADEASFASLTSLARSETAGAHLIAMTLDLRHPRAAAIAALIPREGTLPVTPLSYAHVEDLVRSLFGDVPHVPQLARVLHDTTLGNPGACLELARHLIRSGHIQYEGGAWVLPQELRREDLPSDVEEVQLARFQKLEAGARELSKCLAISRIGMTLGTLAKLSGRPEPVVLRQLDDLISAEAVISDAGFYRFASDGLRTRVLGELEAKHKRALERILAKDLQESHPDDLDAQLESGFHLMNAGEPLAGARRMVQAANTITRERAASAQALKALLLALETLEAHHAPESECLLLRARVLAVAFDVDYRVSMRQSLETMGRLQRYLGFSLANRLAPLLGERFALRVGTGVAYLRHILKGRPRRDIDNLYRNAFGSWLSAIGVAAMLLDRERIDQLLAPMRVICGFGPRSFAAFAYMMGERMRAQTYGQEHTAEQLSLKALDTLRDERVGGRLPQAVMHAFRGGVLFGLGLAQVFRGDGSALRTAQALNALGLAMYEVVAAQTSMIAHAYRGETEAARNFQRRVETLALRGGSTWQTEVFALTNMLAAYYLTHDVIGTKQARQQLARLSAEMPTLAPYTALATALTQSQRGRHVDAMTTLEGQLEEFAPRKRNGWALMRAMLAGAYTGNRQPERAVQLCRETIAVLDEADMAYPLMYVHVERELARAESALGHHGSARTRVNELLQRYAGLDLPLLLGILHRDGAEIALASEDRTEVSRHMERARHYFRLTTNHGLIASIERLAKRVERARTRSLRNSMPAMSAKTDALMQEMLSCTDTEKRAQLALNVLLESAEAPAGFLVLFADHAPYVAAAVNGEPPSSLMTASALARDQESDTTTASSFSDQSSEHSAEASTAIEISFGGEHLALRPYMLMADYGNDSELIGIAWLAQPAHRSVMIDRSLFEAAAQALRPL